MNIPDETTPLVVSDKSEVLDDGTITLSGHREATLGWGYVIVLSNFFVTFFIFGLIQSQSFFFVEWQEYFQASAAEVSFLSSLPMLLLGLFSPVGGMLATAFGSRIIAMVGGALVSIGMLLSMLLDTMTGLNLTWGLITGIGFALVFSPSVAMLGQYFKRYFTTANSIMLTGGAIGMMATPPLTTALINAYGWRGAMLVLSAIMANLIALGATLRPNRQMRDYEDTSSTPLTSNQCNKNNSNFKIMSSLACNVRYMIVLLVFVILGLVLLVPNVHIIALARDLGISESQASLLPTLMGIGNLFGRLSGLIIDKYQLPQDAANVCSSLLCALTFFINPFCKNFWSQAVYCIVFGFGQGAVIVFSFVLAQVLLTNKQRSVGVGFVTMCLFTGYTFGIVLAGWLYDEFGRYDVPFYLMGALAIVGTCLIFVVSILNRRVSI